MPENKAIVYQGPLMMGVEDIGYPKMEIKGRQVEHAVIIELIATNICGSDLHMYRGNTDLAPGTAVGHEMTGKVIEKGRDVEFVNVGDIVSVPFNVACGRCKNCMNRLTHICLNVNDLKPGGAYGYAEMGPYQGGQAQFAMVPYADFNLLVFPDPDLAMDKILDLAMLSDIFPTGYHGVVNAGVSVGSTVYIAGAGPVGICAAISSYLRGAACVIMGDDNPQRLDHVKNTLGCETINIADHEDLLEPIRDIVGIPQVDCAIDAIGFEAHGHGHNACKTVPHDALDTIVQVTAAGGGLGIEGVYLPMDPKAPDMNEKVGRYTFEFGRLWDKAQSVFTGQVPTKQHNRQLMNAILFDRVSLSKALNTTVVSIEDAPESYKVFNEGVSQKFILDPNNYLQKHRAESQEQRELSSVS